MKNILLVIVAFISIKCLAQDVIEYRGEKINALDKDGNPHGIWKVYVDEQDMVIITKFDSGNIIDGPNYYKDSQLITAKKGEWFEIYKDGKIIEARLKSEPLTMPVLIDKAGNELDKDVYKYLLRATAPMYYQGANGLYEFIGANFDYKSYKGQKGKVRVKFIIDKLGKTSEIKIVESTNTALNEEVMRIIGILPRFQPGHQSGKFVRIAMELPVNID